MKILFLLALLAACGSKSGGSSDDAATISPATELEGTWATECTVDNSTGSIFKLVITGNKIKNESYLYLDNTCQSLAMVDSQEYAFTIGDSMASLADAKEIDMTFLSLNRTYKSIDLASLANQVQTYGYTDWVFNQAKDITGKTGFPSGTIIYTIFKITDGKVFFGDRGITQGSTEDSRPETLASSGFTKQ